MNSRERFFAALEGRPVDRAPAFPLLMFFAVDRAGISYREFASEGQAMAEAQLGLLDRFPLDGVTACSDAFRISGAVGGAMNFPEDKPPHLSEPFIQSPADVEKIGRPDPTDPANRMGDRTKAVEIMARSAGDRVAVLGWIDMPFAEACSLCGVTQFMMMLYDDPATAHAILEAVTPICIDFALAQLDAGAPMIGAGDAAASLISPAAYREFALQYEKRVVDAVHGHGGTIKLHVCGDSRALLGDMVTCGADLFNVDHMVPLEAARDVYAANDRCYKGNIDPVAIMNSTPESITRQVHQCLDIARGTRYMVSAGCEVPAETPDEVFDAFCRASQTWAG